MNNQIAFLFAIALPAYAQSYTIIDLHPDSDAASQAWAINRLGDVAGVFAQRAFLWRRETGLQDLGTLPGFNASIAYGLNDAGQVAGCSQMCGRDGCFFTGRAFIYSDGHLNDIGAGNLSCARAINQSGQAVGNSAATGQRAFFWTGTSLVYPFDNLVQDMLDGTEARAINDMGQLAGMQFVTTWSIDCSRSPYPPCRLFDITVPILWHNGVTRAVEGFQQAGFTAINGSGEAAGTFQSMEAGPSRALLWNDGIVTDLGTLPGHNMSSAFGINASGDVVGVSGDCTKFPCEDLHAFLYHAGSMVDLNALIPSDGGWVLNYATAINDAGQIVGFGRKNGQATDRAFLLAPVDEPGK